MATINPLIFLILLLLTFTAVSAHQKSRWSRSNTFPHDARKFSSSSSSSSESDSMIFLLGLAFYPWRGTVAASGLCLCAIVTSLSATVLPRFAWAANFAGDSNTTKLLSAASLLTVDFNTSSSSTSVCLSSSFVSSLLLV